MPRSAEDNKNGHTVHCHGMKNNMPPLKQCINPSFASYIIAKAFAPCFLDKPDQPAEDMMRNIQSQIKFLVNLLMLMNVKALPDSQAEQAEQEDKEVLPPLICILTQQLWRLNNCFPAHSQHASGGVSLQDWLSDEPSAYH